ncbi:MAG: Snf7 family protein [Nitrosopumilaceae archaeon]|nr:Snf7 family protein [Nitrosopumilaceae archaeon]
MGISNSWNSTGGESLSQKVMGKVKPDAPLKNKLDLAQKKLQLQISKLQTIHEKLQAKHEKIFEKIVNAQRSHNNAYAQAYANELVQVRKMRDMVGNARLSMEQINLRLNTVSELGDVVVTLSPAMSVIKGISSSISGIMPEANASMQDLSSVLGDLLSGSAVADANSMNVGTAENADTMAILQEAHSVIEKQTQTTIPDIPDSLKKDVVNKTKSDVLL